MNCRRCNRELKEGWQFCPYCGHMVSSKFDDIFSALEGSIRELFGSDFLRDFPFGKGFMVELSQLGGEPKISFRELGKDIEKEEEREEREGKAIPKNAEVIEPEVKIGEKRNRIDIHLPGVKSEGDINIKEFEDSLELRAFAPRKVYFAIIPIPKHLTLMDKRFENGVLTINLV